MKNIFILTSIVLLSLGGCVMNNPSRITNNTDYLTNISSSNLSLLSRETTNLLPSQSMQDIYLDNNSKFNLSASIVSSEINGKKIRAYAYNGLIPGPILHVKQGSTVYVNFTNNLDIDTTVHWHGIRLENKYDGVMDITQKSLKNGESFIYKLDFPDPGVYWYHPHIREDAEQELGLYGAIIVEPSNNSYFNKVDKEETMILDDLLLDEKTNDVFPFIENSTNFALMGRYGNKIMINGKIYLENSDGSIDLSAYTLNVNKGEIVRLYLLNAANVRPFNFSIEKTNLKIIGSDNGKYEQEFFAGSVILAPSERSIVEVLFNETGTFEIRNQNPIEKHILGKFIVEYNQNNNSISPSFSSLHPNPEIISDIDKYRPYFDKIPDFEYELLLKNGGMESMGSINGQVSGMMGSINGMDMSDMMEHTDDGIEWEDTMFALNQRSSSNQFEWVLKDKKSAKENMDSIIEVKKGQIIKIKIENPKNSMHPMQHPLHIHGVRFLVVKRNGVLQLNLVWKDTVLIPIGENVELITSFPNEGQWMMHCHISEHLGSGMMSSINVSN